MSFRHGPCRFWVVADLGRRDPVSFRSVLGRCGPYLFGPYSFQSQVISVLGCCGPGSFRPGSFQSIVISVRLFCSGRFGHASFVSFFSRFDSGSFCSWSVSLVGRFGL